MRPGLILGDISIWYTYIHTYTNTYICSKDKSFIYGIRYCSAIFMHTCLFIKFIIVWFRSNVANFNLNQAEVTLSRNGDTNVKCAFVFQDMTN